MWGISHWVSSPQVIFRSEHSQHRLEDILDISVPSLYIFQERNCRIHLSSANSKERVYHQVTPEVREFTFLRGEPRLWDSDNTCMKVKAHGSFFFCKNNSYLGVPSVGTQLFNIGGSLEVWYIYRDSSSDEWRLSVVLCSPAPSSCTPKYSSDKAT